MWIYDQTLLPEAGALEQSETLPAEMPILELPAEEIKADCAAEVPMAPLEKPPAARPHSLSAADHWTLAAAFLIGSAAAGVIYALCDEQRIEWLDHYIGLWIGTFSASGAASAGSLFAAEYFTLTGVSTLLLLFGFSAFGPVLIFFFVMLYGAGNGLLMVRLLTGTSWNAKLLIIMLTFILASVAAVCLCLLGAEALRVSGKIRAYSFLNGAPALCRSSSGRLVRQYLLTLVCFLPLCGAAAGLACAAGRWL